MKHQSSLRVRLLLLVLVAVVPLFGMSVYWAVQNEERDLSVARVHLQAAAAAEAGRQDREAEAARLLLVAVANAAEIRTGSAADCQAYLESLRESFPAYNAGVLDLDGTLRCSVRSRNKPSVDTARATYFREAISTRGFAVGEYMPGLLTGRPVLGFGYPVTKAGVVSGVAFAAIRLEDMQRSLSEVAVPDGGSITILDRQARVLASTEPRFKAGAVVPSDRLKEVARAAQTGVEYAVDPADGTIRMHAFAPARGAASGALFVVVGVERAAVVARGREWLHSELAGLLLVTALGAWLAWLYAGRQIVRPARRILDATSSLRAGQLGTRVPGASDMGTEFSRIAAGLNEMAQSLEERDHALQGALAANSQARATQDLVLNTMAEGVIAIDANRNILLFNQAASSVFAPPETPSVQDAGQPSLAGIFKPGTQTLFPVDELPLHRALRGESGRDFDMLVRNELVPEGRLLRGNYRPIMGPDGIVGGMGVFADITKTHQLEAERKAGEAARAAAEQETRDNAERLARLAGIQIELAEADVSASELMDRMAALAQRVTGAPGAEFELITGDDFVLRSSAGTAGRQAGMRRKRGQLSREAIQQARVMRCDDIEQDARVDAEWCRTHGVRSFMGGAIRVEGVPIGGLVLLSDQPDGFSRADAHVLELLCEFLGALLQRKKSAQAIAGHIFMLQRAADAAEAIVSQRTLLGTLQEVADQLRGVIGAHQSFVTAVTDGKWDEATSVVSLSERYAPYRHLMQPPDGSGIYAIVCESNRPLRLNQAELEAHPRWKGFGAYASKHPPMNGWLAVPLIGRDGRSMGVIQLSDKYEGDFELQDEYVALQLAQLVSVAIENARLFDELQEFNRNLELKVIERSREVANQEAVFRAVAEQAPQVMWIINAKGAVTYLNRYWYDLVGGVPPKWLGHEWTEAVDPDDVAEMREKWKVCAVDHSVFRGVRRVSAQDGTIHTLAYRASPVHDDTGAIICWVGLDADITESQLVEQALRAANQELETFSYSVSHDLRSPLNTIAGFSQLLEKALKANDGKKSDHYISRIKAATSHMGELIEGLLALAQVSRQNLSMSTVNLSAMSEEIADRLRREEPDREVHWHIETGMTAHGDARLLRAMLQNLIGNAWKFSSNMPQAEISVGCIAVRGKAPVYFVRDNGAGFDMQYADKLFGAFQRLHGQTEFPGTGIGLATVKRIVTRHGGTVRAESKPGEGATFFFTLNAPEAPAAASSS